MYERNDSAEGQPSTIVALLRSRCLQQADSTAFIFLKDGETAQESLTYVQLDNRAREVAVLLQSCGAAGQRALLLYPAGLEYVAAFLGCLYADVIAVPVYPPRPNQNLDRVRRIANDAGARFVLSTTNLLPRLQHALPDRSVRLLDTTLSIGAADTWREPVVTAESVAFLQYTSGSTGDPKGVVLSHGNLLHNSGLIARAFDASEKSVGMSWLPLYHDMGLIGGVLQPLYGGYPCVLMSPAAFLQRPARWLEAISRYRATISGGPNFAYDLCVRRVTPEQRETLNLDCWELAFTGAEPVRANTLQSFASAFEHCGFKRNAFYPCYGLAEATLMVSGGKKGAGPVVKNFLTAALEDNRLEENKNNDIDIRALVGCGSTYQGQEVVVVHPSSLAVCDSGQVGEIWVAGQSVAQGYWNSPEETETTFKARLPDDQRYFLRTGDLGARVDNELFITGRQKDLIIIRGRNHYPQDIEATVETCDPILRPGCNAAFSFEEDDEEHLAIVQEVVPRSTLEPALIEKIRAEVARVHELQIDRMIFVAANGVPRTSSGKIQRRRCRQKYLERTLEIIFEWRSDRGTATYEEAPQDADSADRTTEVIEAWLINTLAAKLQIEPRQIDKYQPISSFHLDSLAAIELAQCIEAQLGLALPFDGILQGPSIVELARQACHAVPITRVSRDRSLPLSYGQQRMWFAWQLEPDSSLNNVFQAYRVHGALDKARLKKCFDVLIERHEILRTVFSFENGEPIQIIKPIQQIDFAVIDLTASAMQPEVPQIGQFVLDEVAVPFDLRQGPLLRLRLLQIGEFDIVIFLVLHHIIADGWSAHVFVRELAEIYGAFSHGQKPALPDMPVQYADFASWQRQYLRERIDDQLRYWRARLQDASTVLELPLDKPRPPVQRVSGGKEAIHLPKDLVSALVALSQRQQVTLYILFLAAIQVLLHRYTAQESILVGTPVAGRHRSGTEGMIGLFVDTLVMRADFPPGLRFTELLQQVKRTVLEAYAHQDLPFDKLIEALRPERDLSRSPIFQVMFTFHNLRNERLTLSDLVLDSLDIENDTTNFDLSFSMIEMEEGIRCQIKYKTDLFMAATIRRMLGHLHNLLEGIVAQPDERIDSLPLLTPEERRAIIQNYNRTVENYGDSNVIALIEEQVERSPEAIALVFEEERLSYSELNARANQLAHYLRAQGVGPECLVGLYTERSVHMVVGLLGVLKAGGAYLPLDPHHPPERLHTLLQDAQVRLLLTQQHLAPRLAGPPCPVHCLDRDAAHRAPFARSNPGIDLDGQHGAYLIYTSGSTGQPKGVLNTHAGLYNRLVWMQRTYGLTAQDRVLQKTPYSFDVSVWEFLWPLMSGARLILAQPQGHLDRDYLVELIVRENITTIHFVPSMLQVFLDAREVHTCTSLQRVLCSGEGLPAELQHTYHQRLGAPLHNLYGPTEAAIDVTAWACRRNDASTRVPIGRPIANTQIYLLDAALQPVPLGVTGELHIGGIGLARGYHRRPELTADKFIPDPFKAGERLYKSGDLARYRADGAIEYLGRSDHQIKLRGFRIELGEIESALRASAGVKEAVVLVRQERAGDQRLVAYVVGEHLDAVQLKQYLAKQLPEYMLPNAFVMLQGMPLNSNGKIDRKALEKIAPDYAASQVASEFVPPRNFIEQNVAEIWMELMSIDRVSVSDNFFELGGHSLLATQVVSRIRATFNVELALRALFEGPTIAQLGKRIALAQEKHEGSRATAIEPVLRDGALLPLSFAQQRLWFLAQMEPNDPSYNMARGLRLRGRLDISALERTLNEIVRRHESLRTTFDANDGRPTQVIAQAGPLPMPVTDLSALPHSVAESQAHALMQAEAVRPFDLQRDLPIRASLIRFDHTEHVLLFTLHHIAADGWSMDVLVREAMTLYAAYIKGVDSPLPDLPLQYADFANWEQRYLQGETLERLLAYWRRKLAPPLPRLELPSGLIRPDMPTTRGAEYSHAISEDSLRALRKLSQRHGCTLFMSMLAVFKILLQRLTHQDDIVVGTDLANRNRVETEGLIGFFINQLALRTDLSGAPSFVELLSRVRTTMLEAYAHQDLPFDKLVAELKPERDIGRTPFFQFLLVLQNMPSTSLSLPELSVSRMQSQTSMSKFDLCLFLDESLESVVARWVYKTDIFDSPTIARFAGYFETLLLGAIDQPQASIDTLEMYSAEEKKQLVLQAELGKEARLQKLRESRRRVVKQGSTGLVS
ncbi:MAG TPA: amino acid adenylation domain-containing protein [Rhodocyclaceae bacterium]|nr:amino acid adenylation domain-containing protein [Rhodocyclaceae bacterium]